MNNNISKGRSPLRSVFLVAAAALAATYSALACCNVVNISNCKLFDNCWDTGTCYQDCVFWNNGTVQPLNWVVVYTPDCVRGIAQITSAVVHSSSTRRRQYYNCKTESGSLVCDLASPSGSPQYTYSQAYTHHYAGPCN